MAEMFPDWGAACATLGQPFGVARPPRALELAGVRRRGDRAHCCRRARIRAVTRPTDKTRADRPGAVGRAHLFALGIPDEWRLFAAAPYARAGVRPIKIKSRSKKGAHDDPHISGRVGGVQGGA